MRGRRGSHEVINTIMLNFIAAGVCSYVTLYLLKNPDFNVLAITIAGTGETHCEQGVRNAMKLTQLAGRADIPVACGRETPLDGSHDFPDAWRLSADTLMGIPLEDNTNVLYGGTAPVLLTESINIASEPVSLVTLGPQAAFGATAIVLVLAALPIVWTPNVKIAWSVSGSF